jgi:cytochrome b6-f complex iron-sulfur subunit
MAQDAPLPAPETAPKTASKTASKTAPKTAAGTASDTASKKSVSRRQFLNIAWLASLGFFIVDVAGVTFLFAMPRFKEGEFGGIFTIGTVADLPNAGAAPLNYPKVKLWISNTENGLMALYKVCTHLGCLYNWSDQDGKFECPCHGSQYQSNGTYIQGPAPRSLDRFPVQAIDPQSGNVLAESEEGGGPMPVPDNPQAIIQVDTGKRIFGKTHG